MIRVKVHTNRDVGHSVDWPEKMICRPLIGDYVRALGGQCELRVVRVTHITDLPEYNAPYLLVEVNN